MKPEIPHDVKPKYLLGGAWRARIWARGSNYPGARTAGSIKGESCQADKMKKFFARRGKSYKHPAYGDWCRNCDAMNRGKS